MDTARMTDETNPLCGTAVTRSPSCQEEERPTVIVASCCRRVASPATRLSRLSCCLDRQAPRVALLGVVQRRSLVAPPLLNLKPRPMMPQATRHRQPNLRQSRAPSPAGCPALPASRISKCSPANTTTTGSATAVAGAASRRSREREDNDETNG
jgi:hypothetical protein